MAGGAEAFGHRAQHPLLAAPHPGTKGHGDLREDPLVWLPRQGGPQIVPRRRRPGSSTALGHLPPSKDRQVGQVRPRGCRPRL